MPSPFKRAIAALLGLWLALYGGMPVLAGQGGTSCGAVSCCVRKAAVSTPCSAQCCLSERSADRPAAPAAPVVPPLSLLPEWVPVLLAFLPLPDPTLVRWVPALPPASCGSTVALPLFLRDRVFLI